MKEKTHYTEAIARWDGRVNFTYEHLSLGYLAGIYSELKSLNKLLSCPNFIAIPHKLDAIRRNTTKRRKKKS